MFATTYDELLSSKPNVNFYPYVGKDYAITPHKILVLGESHYGSQSNNTYKGWTREVVDTDYLNNKIEGMGIPKWTRCHGNTARMMSKVADRNSYLIYEKIAFYNFFQQSVGESPRSKIFITDKLIIDSRDALRDVLSILKPKLVIGWGCGNLKKKWLPQSKIDMCVNSNDFSLFKIKDYLDVPFWCMRHPSCFFSIKKHKMIFQEIVCYLFGPQNEYTIKD